MGVGFLFAIMFRGTIAAMAKKQKKKTVAVRGKDKKGEKEAHKAAPKENDPPKSGDGGSSLLEGLDSAQTSKTCIMVGRAIHHGWHIPNEERAALPKRLFELLAKETRVREFVRLAGLARLMLKDNIDAIAILDKIERLEIGLSTSNVSTEVKADIRVELRGAQNNPVMGRLLMQLAELQAGVYDPDAHSSNGRNGSNGSSPKGDNRNA